MGVKERLKSHLPAHPDLSHTWLLNKRAGQSGVSPSAVDHPDSSSSESIKPSYDTNTTLQDVGLMFVFVSVLCGGFNGKRT